MYFILFLQKNYFDKLVEAYSVLSDPIERIKYNKIHPNTNIKNSSLCNIKDGKTFRIEDKSHIHIPIIPGSRDIDYDAKRISSTYQLHSTRYTPGDRNYIPPKKLPLPSHTHIFFYLNCLLIFISHYIGILALPVLVLSIWGLNIHLTRKEYKD